MQRIIFRKLGNCPGKALAARMYATYLLGGTGLLNFIDSLVVSPKAPVLSNGSG